MGAVSFVCAFSGAPACLEEPYGEFSEDFRNVCSNDLGCRDVGSVAATLSNNDETSVTLTSACSRGIFDDLLLSLFRKLNQDESNNVIFNSVFLKYTSLSLRGKSYSCSRSSRTGSPYVALLILILNLGP